MTDAAWSQGGGILAALAEAEATSSLRDCQACVALSTMPDDVRAAVERALSGTIGQKRLAQILNSRGYVVGDRAINRHRREDH